MSAGQLLSLVVPALFGPAALALGMLVHVGCTVLNPLELPWEPALQETVRVASFAVAGLALLLVVRGFWIEPWAAGSILLAWVVLAPILLVVVLMFSFGDPAPGSCPNSA